MDDDEYEKLKDVVVNISYILSGVITENMLLSVTLLKNSSFIEGIGDNHDKFQEYLEQSKENVQSLRELKKSLDKIIDE